MSLVESSTGRTGFKLVNGLIFNRGFSTPNFVQEESGGNLVEQSIEFEYPLVLVVANRISSIEQIVPVMELVKKHKKPLVVFSMDLQDDPASTMVYNARKGIVKCCAVNIPWSAGIERENLIDIATMTGATLIDDEHALMLKDL